MQEINLIIKGMMCNGCENRVKNAIENLEGIEKVKADHITGKVKIVAKDSVSKENLKLTIEDIGYEIVGEE